MFGNKPNNPYSGLFGQTDTQQRAHVEAVLAQPAYSEGLRRFMMAVYNYMAVGLVISFATAYAITETSLKGLFFTTGADGLVGLSMLGMIGIFAPLVMLFFTGSVMRAKDSNAAKVYYWVFTALQGIGLSMLLMVYSGHSIMQAFLVTACAFAGLSLWGYTTGKNLSAMGGFLLMGLIGVIVASVINIFFQSSGAMFLINCVATLVFAGLIAYETQSLKTMYVEGIDSQSEQKIAIFGALNLYLSFMNLFRLMLYFLNNRE